VKKMVDKEKVYEIADKYLIMNVGNLVGPGEPGFDNKIRKWIVPIFHMSKVAIFPMGEMIIDTKGNIVHVRIAEGSSETEKKKIAEWVTVLEKPEEVREPIEKMKPRSIKT